MANPKGNPQTLRPFAPRGKKSLKAQLSLKIESNDYVALKEISQWQDKLRAAITELIEKEKNCECRDETSNSAA